MLKTLARLFLERQLGRHGGHKPWKGKKHKRWGRYYDDPRYDPRYDRRYDRPYGHDPRDYPSPYGHHRPRGVKEMIVEAILRRLFRR